jgi:hypothetical protein
MVGGFRERYDALDEETKSKTARQFLKVVVGGLEGGSGLGGTPWLLDHVLAMAAARTGGYLMTDLERQVAELTAEIEGLRSAHDLMVNQFRVMQREKEHGWRENLAAVLAADKALAEKATPGPWRVDHHTDIDYGEQAAIPGVVDVWHDSEDGPIYPLRPADADFIAAARKGWPRYRAIAEKVLKIHGRDESDRSCCSECGFTYPCWTVRVVTLALVGTP